MHQEPISISARTWKIPMGPGSNESEAVREDVVVSIDRSESALLVLDAWENHPNKGWEARLEKNLPNLVKLIDVFRSMKRPIIYDSTGLPLHPSVLAGWTAYDHLIKWCPLGSGTQELGSMLVEWGIRTLFFGGYSANLCVMAKPIGFRNIRRLDWDRKIFLVRDATIAFESADTLSTEALWDAACYEVEYDPNGFTCTVAGVQESFLS